MRLISCYIAGFGKFVDRAFDFSSDLVVLKEDNGWGKTTLADFLKCMLYGLDGGRSKAVDANERMKYEPWNGGVFGGSLVFSCAEKTYRIERRFGKTPSTDEVKVYDGNNMPCYDFGENAGRIGEVLFGVNSDSYRRSVYIPQGEIRTVGVPDDMKNRLLALLGWGSVEENGAGQALEKLDAAERNLRAKRRPGKGKLDEIDERLADLEQERAECERYAELAKERRGRLDEVTQELGQYHEMIKETDARIEQVNRSQELQSLQQTYRELQAQATAAKKDFESIKAFFGDIEPLDVNMVGLKQTVGDYEVAKEKYLEAEAQFKATEAMLAEKTALEARYNLCIKAKNSYDLLMEEKKKTVGAGTSLRKKKREKEEEKKPKKKGLGAVWLVIWTFAVIFGAAQTENLPAVGYPVLILGVLGFVISTARLLKFGKKKKTDEDDVEDVFAMQYGETTAEFAFLEKKLKSFPTDLENTNEKWAAACQATKTRMEALEKSIRKFLQNFRFEEQCDLRLSVSILKDRIEAYRRAKEIFSTCEARVKWLESRVDNQDLEMQTVESETNLPMLQRDRIELEERQKNLLKRQAVLAAQEEDFKNRSRLAGIEEREKQYAQEKQRLEKRLYAVRTAKEILLRVQEKIAARYLSPVEQNCRNYLEYIGANERELRFAADGTQFVEEKGALRAVEYYSVGEKELVGFCTRVALVDAVFTREKPAIVLDDPFINLDDKKTERAKKLVKELSKKYQILYFTCKNERKV